MFNSYKLFEKLFILMPLIHSEKVDDCQYGIDVLESIIANLQGKDDKADLVQLFVLNKRWALSHLEILKEFGRFPNRN